MLDRFSGALVDQHAETATLPAGCRTLCQHPGCGQPIEPVPPTFPGGEPFWMHLVPPDVPSHRATPVEQPEPSPVQVQCPGLGCGEPAWRLPSGRVVCDRTGWVYGPDGTALRDPDPDWRGIRHAMGRSAHGGLS